MHVALVTTPPSVPSGIGDYTRQLLPSLAEHADVDVFVHPDLAGEEQCGFLCRSVAELRAEQHDRILFQLGNERAHAFMLPPLRRLGGLVALHDWILFDFATAAIPALERGGFAGHAAAFREGGLAEARVYAANRLSRRRVRDAEDEPDEATSDGPLLMGWHAPEAGGRWTARRAGVRLPDGVREVRITLDLPHGRVARALEAGRVLARLVGGSNGASTELVVEPVGDTIVIAVDRVTPTPDQRAAGDPRELGAFVRSIRVSGGSAWHELDLTAPAALPLKTVELSDDRFRLALNRSVLLAADAFVVHSDWMREQVREVRGTSASVTRIVHGAQRSWSMVDKGALRQSLGLPAEFHGGFVATSFGAVQEHKRPGALLEAVALARRSRPDLRLVLAGAIRTESLDVEARIAELGLEGVVHVTGYLPEEEIERHMLAAEVCVNLRGPSTGGTSGAIARALGAGRVVIASDLDEQGELPRDCVLHVPGDQNEAPRLAEELIALAEDPARRERMESAARRHVLREAEWPLVAARYAEVLNATPGLRQRRSTRSA